MTDPATCTGTWREVRVPEESGDLHVQACSGCGDWWIHIGRFATVVDVNSAHDVEDAVRIAVDKKASAQ